MFVYDRKDDVIRHVDGTELAEGLEHIMTLDAKVEYMRKNTRFTLHAKGKLFELFGDLDTVTIALTQEQISLIRACVSSHMIALKDQARRFPRDSNACTKQVTQCEELHTKLTAVMK